MRIMQRIIKHNLFSCWFIILWLFLITCIICHYIHYFKDRASVLVNSPIGPASPPGLRARLDCTPVRPPARVRPLACSLALPPACPGPCSRAQARAPPVAHAPARQPASTRVVQAKCPGWKIWSWTYDVKWWIGTWGSWRVLGSAHGVRVPWEPRCLLWQLAATREAKLLLHAMHLKANPLVQIRVDLKLNSAWHFCWYLLHNNLHSRCLIL
jgi:hypothetical protein